MRGGYFKKLLLVYATLLLRHLSHASSPCERGVSWWNAKDSKCINCTICDTAHYMTVVRPCELHRDTLCLPLHQLNIVQWPQRPRNRKKHYDEDIKKNATTTSQTPTRNVVWRYSSSREEILESWHPIRDTHETKILVDNDLEKNYNDYSGSKHEPDTLEESLTSVIKWDIQTTSLILAASGCLLFFVVVIYLSIYHSWQWRRLKRTLVSDVQDISAKLKLMETGSQIQEQPRWTPANHLYCNIDIDKGANAGETGDRVARACPDMSATETEADSGLILPALSLIKNEPTSAPAGKEETPKRGSSLLKCSTCDSFTTSSSRSLASHMAQCSPDNNNSAPADVRPHRKLFECDVCNMKFSNGANMRRHKMRHTGVKPYECRVCQKRFFRKDHLAEHFTTHTKSLPYHCPICNRGFQRQIAMRAHFQNEHVGQHDLVKTCPLCTYRAPTMKSLRVHFFNRHGIDLDNPGPGGSSASLLAAGIANAAFGDVTLDQSAVNALGALGSGLSVSVATTYSDSGDSTGGRSVDNVTPPMHYLTPHVEISMADNETYSPGNSNHHDPSETRVNGSGAEGPPSPQSGDSGAPSHSSALPITNITPSITLIPIKQEPNLHDDGEGRGSNDGTNGPDKHGVSASSLSSLIKVSPLKSLLREDLRRRISARGRGRNAAMSRASPSDGGVTTSTHGDPSSATPASLVCTFCAITFPDSTLYFLHKGCHCDANPWKCNICGEQCCNVYEFNSHLLSKSHQ